MRGHSFGLHPPSVPCESHSSIILCILEKDPPKHILGRDCIRQLEYAEQDGHLNKNVLHFPPILKH